MKIYKKVRKSGVHDYRYISDVHKSPIPYINLYIPYIGRFVNKPHSLHLYEHMCYCGHNGLSKEESMNDLNNHFFEPNGHSTSFEISLYGYPKKDRVSCERILFDMITNPNLDEGIFEIEKNVVKREIREAGSLNYSRRLLKGEMFKLMGFPYYIYANSVCLPERIDDITLSDMYYIRDCISLNCCPEVHVYGDIEDVDKTQNDKFQWKRWNCPRVLPGCGKEVAFSNDELYDTSLIYIGWNLTGQPDDVFYLLYGLFVNFTSDPNYDYSLIGKLRDYGLCYSLDSESEHFSGNKVLNVSIECEKEKVDDVLDVCKKYFDGISNVGLSKERFEEIKSACIFNCNLSNCNILDVYDIQIGYNQRGSKFDSEHLSDKLADYSYDDFLRDCALLNTEDAIIVYTK